METFNLFMFGLDAVIYFTIMVSFLHFRYRLGLGVFLTALGVMHFMETYLAAVFYVPLPFGIVSPGSSIFFAGKLMMILLLYMKEDAATVRMPIYGLFLGNILTVGVAAILQLHIPVEIAPGRVADLTFMREMGWLMVWGTALLYLDSLGIILLYERLGQFMKHWTALRFFLCGAVMLTFDQIGFYTALRFFLGAPIEVFWGGWIAKMFAAGLYSVLFAAYQRLATKGDGAPHSGRSLGDIFNDLTFRERYEDLLARTGKDFLTGAFDRSRLEIEGPRLVHDSARKGETASLIILDADHFKAINDRFGHMQGDATLKEIARIMRHECRSIDLLFRYGGEEFVVLCPGLAHGDACALAERLRRKIAGAVRTPDTQPVTACLGVATLGEDGQDFKGMLSVADARLYRAKKQGRNRTVGAIDRSDGSGLQTPAQA
ncbi:GGDEF domain-containing protein [Chelativorans intermedius]|uniref:diguanylate cyclase n=1 Tax=Chelativorans intermedius TaxID=515947 RepID=A0ABV6DA67_9HYPH|nr:GGDEF domain-containing protein [Chelativorans intermedius]MCT8998636.1 GGDEF domain-containing protein [Chelativorans intermedius]